MNRIREIRKKHNLTAKQLGEKVHVAESTMCLYEKGSREPDLDTLKLIADTLDTTIDYLLGREEKSPVGEKPTEDDVKIALFGGDKEVTDDMWNEVKNFVAYIKQKNDNR